MVIVELAGLLVSTTKVVGKTFSNAFSHSIASNAPNGNLLQKFCGAVFGMQFSTRMTPEEARNVLGFTENKKPSFESIKSKLDKMVELNDLKKGGSPFLNDKFIAASHVLVKTK